jgi:hypothetical protein
MIKQLLVLVICLIAKNNYAQIMEPKIFSIDNHIFFYELDSENFDIVKNYASLCEKLEKRFFKSCTDPIYLTWDFHQSDTTNSYSIGWENMKTSREVGLKKTDDCPICNLGIRIKIPMRLGEEENLVRILSYGLNNKSELLELRDNMIVNKLEYSACRLSDEKMEDVLKSLLSRKQIRFIKRFKNKYDPEKVHITNPYESDWRIKK